MGRVGAVAHDIAVGRVYQSFRTQVTVLAYADVFYFCAIIAFIVVPFCLLISPKTGGGGSGGAH
jgi:DHA2 family multidrug resistance protein